MTLDDRIIKDILLRENYVTPSDMKAAEVFAKSHRTSLLEYLLSKGLITRDLLGQAIAESYEVPYADLNSHQPPQETILKVPEEIAKKYHLVLFSEDATTLTFATDNPEEKNILTDLREVIAGRKAILAYALPDDIDPLFAYYRKPLATRFVDIIASQKRVAPEIIDQILEDALAYHASDIHFEPQEKEVVIRFRVDGVLHEAGRVQKEYYENILNRFKVQGHLKIDEHRSAQDGAMRAVTEAGALDLRISIIPTMDGEKVAIRLLSHYIQGFTLADLGLSARNYTILHQAISKPFGMILAAGPTGSGKTTTLYALLKLLNSPEANVTTIEDPVEYKLLGANQIQVDTQTNLTFAAGLRSIVRQDPDVILVGEIRDRETAEISVNAALTGHLLLSTFHANDAATVIPRMLDMGVEPFLLSSTLELIIAQRLVRRICEVCRLSYTQPVSHLAASIPNASTYFSGNKVTLFKGKGCTSCGGTGYRGRIAIFELIQTSTQIQELIQHAPSAQRIWEIARAQGSRTLFEDGMEKVLNGTTTVEELLRVAVPPRTLRTS